MNDSKLHLINEQRSPLFRIMWVTNPVDLKFRHFDNNITAFHIGGGLIVSVAHNLRTENHLIKSFSPKIFDDELLPLLNNAQKNLFNQCYVPDPVTGSRHLHLPNPSFAQSISETLRAINFDTRWLTLTERSMSEPYLIIQFSNEFFYNDQTATQYFDSYSHFYEPSLKRHTFLLKLKIEKAFFESDIAVYRIIDTGKLIHLIPSLQVDFNVADVNMDDLYCLQSSPAGFLGRLLNKAWLEGFLDHHQIFTDRTGGNYILEGTRYLIKGYFRFGSSGAPYITYDKNSGSYKAIAVQSEASPVQLSINNSREGNYQYVNAIASPLFLIEKELKEISERTIS